MTSPYTTAPTPGGRDDVEMVADQLYDALGYTVRELGIALDVLNGIRAGVEIDQLAAAIAEVQHRVDRVHAVAAELRGRFA